MSHQPMRLLIRTATLRVILCEATCDRCGLATDDHAMFESGPGGDFETWTADPAGALYRLDTALVRYMGFSPRRCRDAIREHAGSDATLRRAPAEVRCKFCHRTFDAKKGEIVREEQRVVFQVVAE